MDKEVPRAARKFEAEFEFTKMETMIHRFPAALGDEMSIRYPSMVVPRVVAIGPYHHGKKHLEKMEQVKNAAAYYLCDRIGVTPKEAWQAVLAVADRARGKYHDIAVADDHTVVEHRGGSSGGALASSTAAGSMEPLSSLPLNFFAIHTNWRGTEVVYRLDPPTVEQGSTATMMTKAYFAAMMFRDACFLLLYMDAYNRSYGDKEHHELNRSIRRFLFSHRDSISSDIMLLENQLPWLVIQTLVGLASQEQIKKELHEDVGMFVAAMGNSFKIRESCQLVAYEWDDDKNPPAHLLALLRRHKTEKPAESVGRNTAVVLQLDDDGGNSNHPLRRPLILPVPAAVREEEGKHQLAAVTSFSAMSPMDLEEIGIQLAASQTAAFSDMGLEKGRFMWSRLTVAPLSLSDTRASCLVNMAALEVCTASRFGDHPDRTAVCSYLALLAFFMVGTGDVRRLRSMGLLHGPHSDGDMLAFFNAVARHLPSGKHFAFLMAAIEEYRQTRPIRTTLYRGVYNHYKTIIKVVSVIVTFIAFYEGLRSLIIHNN